MEYLTHQERDLAQIVASLDWYHTIDLGNGIVTPGFYDHRQYLHHYKLPEDLTGKTVLDIGAASGFFSFEFEKRGAQVTATDLPEWFDHDFGPNYSPDRTRDSGQMYLHQPFEVAKKSLGSNVTRKLINIYDLSPDTVGVFDLVFCGSLLLHLTDPIKAFWNIASVTREKAIIATVITKEEANRPIATLIGYPRGDAWWIPSRTTFELMAVIAGFIGIEWVSEFHLNFRDNSPGPYHGILHAYKTAENWTPQTKHKDEIVRQIQNVPDLELEINRLRGEIQSLQAKLSTYEQSRLFRVWRRIRQVLAG